MIQINFEIQLQMMNFQNSKCNSSNLCHLLLTSFCWENSCSKSDQEKDYLQN